ncbi:Gfo/Idh/MocA family protein [Horticoccus sp. 23ND18S-11]|uniref:Gfo/Idh/MocA family protein n=1 Tax=Horticoccus sp. 23ND18S-11 TaxID=3391832 RepID=UPI0039C97ED8
MNSLTRRTFLQKTTLAAGATLAASRAFQPSAHASAAGANDTVRLGLIGLNGKGSAHLKNLLKMPGVRVAGLCDVDPRVLERAAATMPANQPAPFKTTDARELIGRADIDAVMIVTSNHWHALLTVWACQAGKDVYVEKPMSRTVWEGRKMIEAAAKYNRIVQVGTHYRSETGLADAIRYLHEGQLGKIKHIRAIVYNLRLSIGRKLPWYPEGLNYDVFCGPTPMRPLERNNLHYDWHWEWDTGNGELGNNGVHVLDIALRIAKHNAAPRRIVSFGNRYGIDDVAQTPNTHVAVYDYPEIPLLFEHRALPAKPGVSYMDQHGGMRTGVVAHCEGGYFSGLIGGTAYDPSGKVIKKFAGDGGGTHVKNFFDAVRSRRKQDLAAPVETGHISASLCHFGNISYRVGAPAATARIDETLGAFLAASEIHRELQTHLGVHGIDVAKQPFRLGPWLNLDAIGDGITSLDTPDDTALARARFLLKETQRPPYVIPEQV